MKNPHMIMPMSGAGSRFYRNGYMIPKPLIEIAGKPFLYWSARSIEKFIEVEDITFVVLNQHIRDFHIDQVILTYFPDAKIVGVDFEEVKSGPVMTCLAGIRNIEDERPILVNDCDHMFCSTAFNEMVKAGWNEDGTVLTFESDEPQFGYIMYDDQGNVCSTVEKQVVSHHAICGAYGFRNAAVFRAAAEAYLKTPGCSEFYVSGVFNAMCRIGLHVKDYPVDYHVSFGTPDEYEAAKSSERFAEMER